MAINVYLYTVTKRENSTLRTSGDSLNFQCELIDETSLYKPTLKLAIGSNPIGRNYCYIPDFGNRYYFITNITSSKNFWYISCECDVMATYKTQIGAQSHYVLRCASEYDGDIEDTVYPATTEVAQYINYADDPPGDPLAYSNGACFVLGIVGYTDVITNQFGSIIYYVMNHYALKGFLQYLMNNVASGNDPWGGILTTEYSEGVQKALINPIQYIKSCICMPFRVQDITGDFASTIKFGYYNYDVPSDGGTHNFTKVKVISEDTVVKLKETTYINVKQHPQAATRGAYLNCQPYTRYILHYGPWGDIDLDPMLVKGNNKIKLETLYDLASGVGRLIVSGNLNTAGVIFNGSTKVGVDVNLSQVYKDALAYEKATTNTLFGSISAGTNAAMSNNPIGGIASGLGFITSGVQDMTRLNYPTVSGVGSGGSYMSFKDDNNLYLLTKCTYIVDENREEIGRPLCQTRRIDTLSGYILCDKADCQITGTHEEAIKVNQYLNSGFFYE